MTDRPKAGVTLILGAPGAGKTIMLQALEEDARRSGWRTVVWDMLGYWGPAPGRTVVSDEDPEEAALVACANAPCVLVMDEAHCLAYPQSGPRKKSALFHLAYVGRNASANKFRRRGPVLLLLASQRPGELWGGIRSCLDRAYVGRFPPTLMKGDREWLSKLGEHFGQPDLLEQSHRIEGHGFMQLQLS